MRSKNEASRRSALFSEQFRQVLRNAQFELLRLLGRSPNLNVYAESFVRQECLDRMVFFGEASLRKAVEEFVSRYNCERNHQHLKHKIIRPETVEFPAGGRICREGALVDY